MTTSKQPRRFTGKRDPELFEKDLNKYKDLALALGAADVKFVDKNDVIFDERVIARCYSPRCGNFGTNLNCPPHAPGIDEMRKVVDLYEKGLLIMLKVSPEEQAGPDYYNPEKHKIPGARKLFDIVEKIQSEAYYDGYPLAVAFGGGPSCKRVFCGKLDCSGISGQGCRMHLKSNLTMHGVGMDVFAMSARAGWEIFAIGKASCPNDIPFGLEIGLVLID